LLKKLKHREGCGEADRGGSAGTAPCGHPSRFEAKELLVCGAE